MLNLCSCRIIYFVRGQVLVRLWDGLKWWCKTHLQLAELRFIFCISIDQQTNSNATHFNISCRTNDSHTKQLVHLCVNSSRFNHFQHVYIIKLDYRRRLVLPICSCSLFCIMRVLLLKYLNYWERLFWRNKKWHKIHEMKLLHAKHYHGPWCMAHISFKHWIIFKWKNKTVNH